MFYQPQDRLRLQACDQVVEVVMTSTGSKVNGGGGYEQVPESLAGTGTGSTLTSYCAEGCIIVKTVNPHPLDATLKSSDTVHLGLTLAESQDVVAQPRTDYPYFDYNFVQHMEITLGITEDRINLQETM